MNQINHHKLLRRASYLSVLIATLILTTKIYAWVITDSASVFASLIDSSLDITSSFITMIALRLSLVPPDDNHRFGHEKIQDLAVFGQAMFFIASSIFVIFSALEHLQKQVVVTNPTTAIYVMIIPIIATVILLAYQQYVISITNSYVIKADKLHYVTDLLADFSVIISIYASSTYWFLDAVFAILIGIYLFFGSYKILSTALLNLLDAEFSKTEKLKIFDIINHHKNIGNIISFHDLKTRKAGDKHFIQFHLVMNAEKTLKEVHEISELIEHKLLQDFVGAEVIIHQDPEGYDEDIAFREDFDDNK